INPVHLRRFGYPEVERLAPKGWAKIFEIAIANSRPEPYGRNSNLAYKLMTFPLKRAEQMSLAGELPTDYEKRVDVLQELLRAGTRRANEEMMGIITPGQRRKRDVTAIVVLAAIAVTFGLIFRKVFKLFTPPAAEGFEQAKWQFRRYAWAYLLLVPAAATILIWKYVPLARGSIMAFQDYRLLRETSWVWVENFGDLLWDNFWWRSVWNALRYSFLVISMTFLPPIVLAILLQEVPRGRLLFRTVFYLPAVTTGLVTIILWKQFYEPNEYGVLNTLVLKIPAIAFLALGVVLLLIALAFVRRMLYHGMRLAAWLFALAGAAMLITCAGLAKPILLPTGSVTAERLVQSWPAGVFVAAVAAAIWAVTVPVRRLWRRGRTTAAGMLAIAAAAGLAGLAAGLLSDLPGATTSAWRALAEMAPRLLQR
ncbi:hypothetical protein LCGC14_2742950, partial [marine sediment metagenome]